MTVTPCPVCGTGLLGDWGSEPHEAHLRQSRYVSIMAEVIEELEARGIDLGSL